MAWDKPGTADYSGNPADSAKDEARYYIQDTGPVEYLLSNEEINFAITETGTAKAAAIQLCESLAVRFARDASTSISAGGGMSTSVSTDRRSETFAERAKQLRQSLSRIAGMIFAGGISKAGKQVQTDNTDNTEPFFTREMGENTSIG